MTDSHAREPGTSFWGRRNRRRIRKAAAKIFLGLFIVVVTVGLIHFWEHFGHK